MAEAADVVVVDVAAAGGENDKEEEELLESQVAAVMAAVGAFHGLMVLARADQEGVFCRPFPLVVVEEEAVVGENAMAADHFSLKPQLHEEIVVVAVVVLLSWHSLVLFLPVVHLS